MAQRPRPSPQPVKAGDKAATATVKSPKALYRAPSVRGNGDNLGDIAGSGLPGSGLPSSGIPGSGIGGSGLGSNNNGMPSPRPANPRMDTPSAYYNDIPDENALLQGSNAAQLPISNPLVPSTAPETGRGFMVAVLIGVSLAVVALLIVLILVLTGRKPDNNIVFNVPTPQPTVTTPPAGAAPNATPAPSPVVTPTTPTLSPTTPAGPAVVVPAPITPAAAPVAQGPVSHPNPPNPVGNRNNPMFFGVKFTNLRSIVFVLDNGVSNQSSLAGLNRSVVNSLAGMPNTRTVHIEYWDNATGPSFPQAGMLQCDGNTGANAAAVLNNAASSTDPAPDTAMQTALALKPDCVVFVCGRNLDDATRDRLIAMVKATKSKMIVFGLNGAAAAPLQALAAANAGGSYHDIPARSLLNYAR
jgi:hypothetical protein